MNEWHTLAYNEMNEIAKRDMPGVWTHGFYDGWAPNYMLAMVNLHNSIGRFLLKRRARPDRAGTAA